MKSNFAIAYADEKGKDLNGIPWIFDDINNEEECMSKTLEMISDGFKSVIPFHFDNERKQNIEKEFDWEYVKKHRIDKKK